MANTTLPAKVKTRPQASPAATIETSPHVPGAAATATARIDSSPTPLQARSSLTTIYENASNSSTHSSPDVSNIDDTLLSIEDEDDIEHFDEHEYKYTNELNDGYEDEDDSMELSEEGDEGSDGEDSTHEDPSFTIDFVEEDDTIEDVTNVAPRVVTPPPQLDLSGYSADEDMASEDTKKIKKCRSELEMALREELEGQQSHAHVGGTHAASSPTIVDENILPFTTTSEPGGVLTESRTNVPSPTTVVRHVSKSPHHGASMVPDTPFTTTLNYFKRHGIDKENFINVKTKPRRNASLPEEIADLNREAANEDEHEDEDEDLDQYRAMDLTPIDPIMESNQAGDLITFSSPMSVKTVGMTSRARVSSVGGMLAPTRSAFGNGYMGESGISELVLDELRDIEVVREASGQEEEDTVSGDSSFGPEKDAHWLKSTESEAKTEAVSEKQDMETGEVKTEEEYPTFVKVIGLVPGALFWVVAAPIARAASKTYDVLIEKLTGLEV